MSDEASTGPAATTLVDELYALLRSPLDPPLTDDAFDALALRVFEHQYQSSAAYRAYCDRRERSPHNVSGWQQIPVVPTAAFKALPLTSGDAAHAQVVFRTSGTTAGSARRGTRYMIELGLYHAAAVSFFDACMLPDDASLPFLSLVPSPRELGDSSLAHMIGLVTDRLGGEGSACFASVDGGLHIEQLLQCLEEAEHEGRAVCMLGTSLSFVHLLDAMKRLAVRFRLAPGSRLMDTGGTKGAGRELDAGELRDRYVAAFGIEAAHCVNEYGMTELCSQFYDDSLRRATDGAGPPSRPRRKIAPRWVRSRVVDPVTLEPMARGETGILQHFDLASYDAVLAVQTEDLAREVDDGFVLLGREADAPPRGCSIAMDELLGAARAI